MGEVIDFFSLQELQKLTVRGFWPKEIQMNVERLLSSLSEDKKF